MKFTMNQLWGGLAVCLAAILWGLDGVVLTPRLFNLEVSFVVFVLHALPFLIMNVFLFKKYTYLRKFDITDIIIFLLIAIFGGSLGTIAIVNALFLVNFDHLSVVVLLQKLQPVFAVILASFLLKERISKDFVIWATVAVVASYFLAFGANVPNFKIEKNYIQAILFSLLAAVSFGSSTVFGKKILIKYDFATATFYRFGFTTILMLIYVVVMGNYVELNKVSQSNIVVFFLIALTTGGGAIFLYYYGLQNITAIVSTICELCFPISAVLLDYFIHQHTLSYIQWISAIIMLIAIININILGSQKNEG